jgi:hypothetical protein
MYLMVENSFLIYNLHILKLISCCHVATYSKFRIVLTTYGLPCDNLKLGIEHFWHNCVMPCGDQGLGSLTKPPKFLKQEKLG